MLEMVFPSQLAHLQRTVLYRCNIRLCSGLIQLLAVSSFTWEVLNSSEHCLSKVWLRSTSSTSTSFWTSETQEREFGGFYFLPKCRSSVCQGRRSDLLFCVCVCFDTGEGKTGKTWRPLKIVYSFLRLRGKVRIGTKTFPNGSFRPQY